MIGYFMLDDQCSGLKGPINTRFFTSWKKKQGSLYSKECSVCALDGDLYAGRSRGGGSSQINFPSKEKFPQWVEYYERNYERGVSRDDRDCVPMIGPFLAVRSFLCVNLGS